MRHEIPEDAKTQSKMHLIGFTHMFDDRVFCMRPWRIGIDLHLGLGPRATGIAMGAVRQPTWPIMEDNESFRSITTEWRR